MRQSDGSEILGPNDPRNLVIGIIHVSPNDDRQSVVNAIAAQDKQGRDQIVLVLPVQNKSFKSAVDFAGLHQISSELEAALVLVVPEKSKIANLARKESFTIYPTLEELVSSEFPPLEPDSTPGEYDEAEQTLMFPLELPNTPPVSAPVNPPAPPPAPIVPPPAPAAQQMDIEEEEEEEPTSPSLAVPKMPPAPVTAQEEEEEPTNPSLAVPKMPPAPVAAQEEEEEPTSPSLGAPGTSPAADQQATSDRAGRGAPGSYLPAVVPNNTGALVPQTPQLPVYYEPLGPPTRRRSWRGLIITAVTVVVLIGLAVFFNRRILDLLFPPTATVTIVPRSQRLIHTYQITAVLGVPDPSKNQVDARALYADSQTQTQTARATGQGHIAGQQAHGELTFYKIPTATR